MSETAAEVSSYDVDRSTHFLFEHKVFQLKGARFALTEDGTQPAFHVDLGALNAALSLATVRSEFGINPNSADGGLLEVVEKSLRFVKEIRPGDSIPRELLDGSASWSVEERHRLRAKAHLWARIVGANETKGADDKFLAHFVGDANTESRLQAAVAEIAAQSSFQLDTETVMSRIESLARELAYTEALQERCGLVLGIVPKVNQLARAYRGDRGVLDELARVRTLLLRPIEQYDAIFASLGQKQENGLALIEGFSQQVKFIREQRDDVHQSMMLWDSVLATWKDIEFVRCTQNETKITELYRFIARNFLAQQEWARNAD